MSTTTDTPITKIEISLSQAQKETLEKAALMRFQTLNEYLVEVALNLATQTPPEPEQIVLSERDWEIFASAIENPPPPNEALKAAIKEYQEEYGKW